MATRAPNASVSAGHSSSTTPHEAIGRKGVKSPSPLAQATSATRPEPVGTSALNDRIISVNGWSGTIWTGW